MAKLVIDGFVNDINTPIEELLLLVVSLWRDDEDSCKCRICGCSSKFYRIERHYSYCPRLRIIREFGHEYKRHHSMEVDFGGHKNKLLAPYEELPRIMNELFPDIFEEI